MYIYLTLTVYLAASVLFADNWLYGKYPKPVQLAVPFILATVVYFILFSFWKAGAFPVALVLGQISCLMCGFFIKNRKLLSEICLCFGSSAIWIPIVVCKQAVWRYALFFAIVLFCIALIPQDKINKSDKLSYIKYLYVEKSKYYYILSCLPAAVFLPAVLVFAFKNETVFSAFAFSIVLFVFYALLLWLQREIALKITAEEFNESLSRWQKESRDYMNTIQSQRHDFNLHLHAISGLINSGEYKKCNDYVQKLVADANAVNDIMPVSDAVVGSMLYNMCEEARRRGSDIIYHITYDMADILCNGFECNKIIGNLLQNAIDALYTQEDKDYGITL